MAGTTLLIELQQKINNIKASQRRIENNLNQAKTELNTSICSCIEKVMSDEDFINNEEYNTYFTQNTGATTVDASMKRDWLATLSKEAKIDLLAEYSIDAEIEKGENIWQKDLINAQKAKDVTKKAIAIQAKKVIEQFNALSIEHEKVITELKGKVKEKKAEIKEKDNDLKDVDTQITENIKAMQASKNYTPTKEQIDVAKQAIEGLNTKKTKLETERETLKTELANLETDLSNMEEQRDIYKAAIEEAISQLEESLKNEEIYVGAYEGLGKSEDNSQSNTQTVVGSNTVQGGTDDRKPKDIAKAMMKDFENLSPVEIKQMLEHTGYGDLINMSRELGPINRRKLNAVIHNILASTGDSLELDVQDNSGNNIRITNEELENISTISDDKFDKIIEQMNAYDENYDNMSVHERKIADQKMELLKIAMLFREVHSNKVGRFLRSLSKDGARIRLCENALNRFSKTKGAREDKKWQKNQDIRTILKVKTPIPSTDRKKRLDRSGKNPLER